MTTTGSHGPAAAGYKISGFCEDVEIRDVLKTLHYQQSLGFGALEP